jgi:hypothetical protein
MNRKPIFAAAVFCFAGWISAEPAKPEPFEDILRDAVKEYRAGRVEKSREALDRAVKLLDERKSGKVVDSFPDAPEGWTVGDVEKSEIPAIMGGGRSIKKIYREKEGKKEVTLEVIHDSPFGKLLMGLMVNDAVAEAQGFKVRSVGGDRALLKESADGGELNLPIDEKILVKLTSKGGALEKDMMALARYVDRRSLKKVE